MSNLQQTDLIEIINHILPTLNKPKLNANKDKIIQYFKDKEITITKFSKLNQKSLVENLEYYLGQKSLHVTLIKFHHEIQSYLENKKREHLSYCSDYTVGDLVEIKGNYKANNNSNIGVSNSKNLGIIRFIGEIEGRNGIFYGIELNEANGKHNGSINNIQYFYTDKNKGLFLNKKKKKVLKLIDTMSNLRVTVGDIVRCDKYDCNAIIRFIGETQFKPNIIWYGLQLEKPEGKNNGTIGRRKYFTCFPKYGVFVQSMNIESVSNDVEQEENNNNNNNNKNQQEIEDNTREDKERRGKENYNLQKNEIREIPTISILRLNSFIKEGNDKLMNDDQKETDTSYKLIQKYYFTVSGYSRMYGNADISIYDGIMLQILIYYYTNPFMRIYISKEHSINYQYQMELTDEPYDVSILNELYSFNQVKCPNCRSNELNYVSTFKAVIEEKSEQRWYPRGNAYICNKCKYLTICELKRFHLHQVVEEYEYDEDIRNGTTIQEKHIIDIQHDILPVHGVSDEHIRLSEIVESSCIFCSGNEYFLGFGKGQNKSPYDWIKKYFCSTCGVSRRTKYYDKAGDDKYKLHAMAHNSYRNAWGF